MNEVRIIGGMWKRRKLAFPSRTDLRPSPDRTRVTLFNWLAGHLDGRRCLDLFAGSGALGFEAASRGASEVVLVEHDGAAARALEATKLRLAASMCTIVRADALAWLTRERQPFDIVFLDPPFAGPLLERALALLRAQALVLPEGWVYIEFRAGSAPPLSGWQVVKSARSGAAASHLLRVVSEAPLPVPSPAQPRGGS
jgi:16S rRNA (guanine(966)-N(2))-methyltransferase RsmD